MSMKEMQDMSEEVFESRKASGDSEGGGGQAEEHVGGDKH